ncbi:hypothetical protein P5V15_001805 [Pogonomyrmex californicus]
MLSAHVDGLETGTAVSIRHENLYPTRTRAANSSRFYCSGGALGDSERDDPSRRRPRLCSVAIARDSARYHRYRSPPDVRSNFL